MKRLVFLAVSLQTTAGGSLAAFADAESHSYGPHMWGGGWYGMLFGPLMMIVFVAGIVVVAVLVVRWIGGPGHGVGAGPPAAGRTPIDLLKERFARGEIDRDEFEERRRVLTD